MQRCIKMTGKAPTILYLVTEDWYFVLHRLPIARQAYNNGCRIIVVTRIGEYGELLEKENFEVENLDWERKSVNPVQALLDLRKIKDIYDRYRPDIVHHIAIKPSIFGSIVALRSGPQCIVNNLAGLGSVFSDKGLRNRILRFILMASFRILFKQSNTVTIVENRDDRDFLLKRIGLAADSVALIRGIGVNTAIFDCSPEPEGKPVVTMVSRLLWSKGVGILVEAARILVSRGASVTIRLVGTPDISNRDTVSEEQLQRWNDEGVVEWVGHKDDIAQTWRNTNIAVLPSYYREGVPRTLLEAASCCRALITTDMPGCREIVQHGVNGLLVPPQDPHALADAIEKLIGEPQLRSSMGLAGRSLVEKEFSEDYVVRETYALYERLLTIQKGSGYVWH